MAPILGVIALLILAVALGTHTRRMTGRSLLVVAVIAAAEVGVVLYAMMVMQAPF